MTAFSYPLSLPSTKDLAAITMRYRTVVGASESPFTLEEQTQAHPGARWEAECTLPPMERANAEEWIAFLLELNGKEGTFNMGDPKGRTPRGTAAGTPVVSGASQTGNTLDTTGWTADQGSLLLKGDYFQLGSGGAAQLHKVIENEASDGSGNSTLAFVPPLRSSPADSDPITVSNTVGLFRLSTNEIEWTVREIIAYGITFPCREAL